jgi:solute carrier family 35 protein E1
MALFRLLRLSHEWRQVVKVVLLCLSWYSVSAANNVIGKTILVAFPHPMTVTMVQLLSISVYSGPFFRYWGVRKFPTDLPSKFWLKAILPLSFGKFFSATSAHISLLMVSVSYSHTGEFFTPFQITSI